MDTRGPSQGRVYNLLFSSSSHCKEDGSCLQGESWHCSGKRLVALQWEEDSSGRGLKSSWGSEGSHKRTLTLPSFWHHGPEPQALDTGQLSAKQHSQLLPHRLGISGARYPSTSMAVSHDGTRAIDNSHDRV